MEQEINAHALDKRFYTNQEIKIYDSVNLIRVIRTVPKGTLLAYERLVIRKGQPLARRIEANGDYSYFSYKGCTTECSQCVVLEGGLDVLDIEPANLTGIKIKVEKKAFVDKNAKLESGQVHIQNGQTVLLLNQEVHEKNKIVSVTIHDTYQRYTLMHLQPNTLFYSFKENFLAKGTTIILLDGRRKVLFHEDGLFKEILDGWAKFQIRIMTLLALLILGFGIWTIAAKTGYLVIVGFVMIPVAFGLAYLLTFPILFLIRYLIRYL
ncbi:hypothetical protein [Cytophaga hutchinsonii]|jgi:hypothetical protein|uniref:Uncharacterized protein n=1 Tax=Cytophaga hutchinsonii (strain ATCC 33406 / DSM 1761 / CIP 103989 / NBRC 15051 / NCIMB 9469 / D465) TaxID=269798 RepID=A0A6N4STH5_CYTH3|nr:hypothetical protein [Cytophaga hutchinsonii]ABG59615.1 hypothetical protein CHU_2357 [Cytophaga hutchinsonii ATCC 33406]SFX67199.1 hypothetical protein SAMN04487930_107175 [Cytophaga hutchinsonii ATCC 33406]